MKIQKIKTEEEKFELTFTAEEIIEALESHFKQRIPTNHISRVNPDSWNEVEDLKDIVISWKVTTNHPASVEDKHIRKTLRPGESLADQLETWPREMP